MLITIDTKWVESLEDFDTQTKVVMYDAIFAYMSDKEVNLPDDTWKMFHVLMPMLAEEKNKRLRFVLMPMLAEEKNKRLRLAERSRQNGKKGGRKKKPTKPVQKKLLEVEEYRSDDLKKLDVWMEEKTPYIYENIRHINEKEYKALMARYTIAQICDTLQQIENRRDLRKRYTNLYRTLLNWLKNDRTRNE